MIKRSLKYLIIAGVNMVILTSLLAIWTDRLEITFNVSVRPIEFLKIIGFTILSLIAIRILIAYFRKKKVASIPMRLKGAALLTLLISSYLYYDYTSKVLRNRIFDLELRRGIMAKVEPSEGMAFGTSGQNLTYAEYVEISEINWFPDLPSEATDINYSFDYDGFLPDYYFSLSYDLPMVAEVEEIDIEKSDYSKNQTFEIKNGKKRVIYSESER